MQLRQTSQHILRSWHETWRVANFGAQVPFKPGLSPLLQPEGWELWGSHNSRPEGRSGSLLSASVGVGKRSLCKLCGTQAWGSKFRPPKKLRVDEFSETLALHRSLELSDQSEGPNRWTPGSVKGLVSKDKEKSDWERWLPLAYIDTSLSTCHTHTVF